MAEWFDYNPDTGVTEWFDYDDDTGNVTIRMEQDVELLLERAKWLRDSGQGDKGIKNNWWHYCIIPTTVQVALRQKGLDIMSKDPQILKAVFKEIDRNYPYLKTTNKKHT